MEEQPWTDRVISAEEYMAVFVVLSLARLEEALDSDSRDVEATIKGPYWELLVAGVDLLEQLVRG
jgi:hypothetical protein